MEQTRTVTFRPYRPGMGPQFKLVLTDPGDHDSAGRWAIGYRLYMDKTLLFDSDKSGHVYAHCAIDGTDAIRNVMTWLTLRPGDTDAEYFAQYTPDQLAYAESHAEALGAAVNDRFGDADASERIRTYLERMNWSFGRGDYQRSEVITRSGNEESGFVHTSVDRAKYSIRDGVLRFRGHQRKVS